MKNIQNFNCNCIGSKEIAKIKVVTVLLDTLYKLTLLFINCKISISGDIQAMRISNIDGGVEGGGVGDGMQQTTRVSYTGSPSCYKFLVKSSWP